MNELPTCNNCHRKTGKKPANCHVRKIRSIVVTAKTCRKYWRDAGLKTSLASYMGKDTRTHLNQLRRMLPKQRREVHA